MPNIPLPAQFLTEMADLLGPDLPVFEAALAAPTPVSIRFNPFKIKPLANGEPVPWALANYLPARPVFALDPAWHAGAYYVQEASSMFLGEALRQVVDFSKPLKIMDLCAAPGGKSTLLASLMNAESLLVANEVIRTRTAPLRENLERWGCPNVAVVSAEAEDFAQNLPGWFDVVVADAPCSGEGLFRKDPDARREWSPANVEHCAGRQRRILAAAVEMLAPGGILAFSTCTFNRRENEENAAWLVREFGLEALTIKVLPEWGIAENGAGGLRFYPHRVRGEGFFLTVFRKNEGQAGRLIFPNIFKNIKPLGKQQVPEMARWLESPGDFRFFQTPNGEVLALPAAHEGSFLLLDKFLKIKWFGTAVGEFKGKDFAPAHALAMSNAVAKNLPALELDREQSLRFLRKEVVEVPPGAPLGWALVKFEGLHLGWVKILPGRLNNYLPMERRLRLA